MKIKIKNVFKIFKVVSIIADVFLSIFPKYRHLKKEKESLVVGVNKVINLLDTEVYKFNVKEHMAKVQDEYKTRDSIKEFITKLKGK